MVHYGILVNTCDKFEDCWDPYFKLHQKYWPNCNGTLYLNTEYKTYSYPGLKIVPIEGCKQKKDAHKITWSECLIRALDKIEEDVVLYMQEDYFLNGPVDNELVEKYIGQMANDSTIDCIHLTTLVKDDGPSEHPGLYNVALKHEYRISCQAALWRKDVLRSYLMPHENAWHFEEFGSKRAAIFKHHFYLLDPSRKESEGKEILPYLKTGIVRGRWLKEVVPLFAENGIIVDFFQRGFFKGNHKRSFFERVKAFRYRLPVLVRSYSHLLKMVVNQKGNQS